MIPSTRPLLAIPLAALIGLGTASTVDAAAERRPPGRAMKSSELKALYQGRTWKWKNGGGYFAIDGSFAAWTGMSKSKATYARGEWYATDEGKICFQATWYVSTGSSEATTCFAHRMLGNAIYQRKEPVGPWYVLKQSPAAPGDEFNKLRRGDQVTSRLSKIQTTFQTTVVEPTAPTAAISAPASSKVSTEKKSNEDLSSTGSPETP